MSSVQPVGFPSASKLELERTAVYLLGNVPRRPPRLGSNSPHELGHMKELPQDLLRRRAGDATLWLALTEEDLSGAGSQDAGRLHEADLLMSDLGVDMPVP
jgi:hypothetical protein